MDCNSVKKLFSSYLDEELEINSKRDLENHIQECSTCRNDLKEMENLILKIHSLSCEKLPDNFLSNLHNKLISLERSSLFQFRNLFTPKWAISYAAIILFITFYLWNYLLFKDVKLQKEISLKSPQKASDKLIPKKSQQIVIKRSKEKKKIIKYALQKKVFHKRKKQKIEKIAKKQINKMDYYDIVLRVNLKSEEDEKKVSIKMNLPECVYSESNSSEISLNSEIEKDKVTTILIPIKVSKIGKTIKTKVFFNGTEEHREVLIPKIIKNVNMYDREKGEKLSGFVLAYVPFDKKIDYSEPGLYNEPEFKESNCKIKISMDVGKMTILPLSFKNACLIPTSKGKLEIFSKNENVDITNFQFVPLKGTNL